MRLKASPHRHVRESPHAFSTRCDGRGAGFGRGHRWQPSTTLGAVGGPTPLLWSEYADRSVETLHFTLHRPLGALQNEQIVGLWVNRWRQRNHNPRVGGSSPSSAIHMSLRQAAQRVAACRLSLSGQDAALLDHGYLLHDCNGLPFEPSRAVCCMCLVGSVAHDPDVGNGDSPLVSWMSKRYGQFFPVTNSRRSSALYAIPLSTPARTFRSSGDSRPRRL